MCGRPGRPPARPAADDAAFPDRGGSPHLVPHMSWPHERRARRHSGARAARRAAPPWGCLARQHTNSNRTACRVWPQRRRRAATAPVHCGRVRPPATGSALPRRRTRSPVGGAPTLPRRPCRRGGAGRIVCPAGTGPPGHASVRRRAARRRGAARTAHAPPLMSATASPPSARGGARPRRRRGRNSPAVGRVEHR